ncbi:hypothetical protein BsWGS_25851 [Bradybaena similaris]
MIGSMLLDVLFLVVSVTTLCQGARIVMSAIPSIISEGVTHTFTIRCALEDNGDSVSHISRVSSIVIRKTEASTQTEVARITSGQVAAAGPGARGALVSGGLSNKLGHLEATWSPPGHSQSGSYNCEIVTIDADGINSKFRTNIQVESTGANCSSLATQVAQNKEEIQALRKGLSDLEINVTQQQQKLAECQGQIEDLRKVVDALRTDITGLSSPHNEEGGVVCQNSDTWGENMKPREKVVEVRFSTPYTKNPLVDISLDWLDVDSSRNTRYGVYIRDLTPTGFKVVCATWANTLVYQMNVRWTSKLG